MENRLDKKEKTLISHRAQMPSGVRSMRRYALPGVALLLMGYAWQLHVTKANISERRVAGRFSSSSEPNLKMTENTAEKNHAMYNETLQNQASISDEVQPSIKNAQALIDKGFIQQGSLMLEKLIDQDPTDTQALMEMAMVYTLDLKEPHKSRQILERIVDINPHHRAALNELELLYRELEAVEDGLSFLDLKAQQHPESLEIQYAYGRLLATANPQGALPWLERATLIADQREQALDQLAAAALRSGNIALAVKAWSEALLLAETELERAKANGEPGIDYLEERISSTKNELARAEQQLKNKAQNSRQ